MRITRTQKQAASHKLGNALVLAGPGTGKTTTLVERCSCLLGEGVPLDALFVTAFTQKSAGEIKARLRSAIMAGRARKAIKYEEVMANAWIGTFHSLCARLLKKFPVDAGLPYDFTIISDEDQRQMLYALGFEWDEDECNFLDQICRWKEAGISPEDAIKEASRLGDRNIAKAARAYTAYEKERLKTFTVDFTDLISLATKILEYDGEGARWFRSRFKHFVVDEFQDCNRNQIAFLRAAVSREAGLWAVGDENQSLYEWRGSSPEYCLRFEMLFPPAHIYHLEESFRCSPQIIEMATRVISRNRNRFEKAMRPARKAADGEMIMFRGMSDAEAEGVWIARHLKQYSAAGGKLSDIAILFRSSGIAATLQRHLEQQGIPLKLMGTSSFWALPEVSLYVTGVAAISGDKRFDLKQGFGKTKVGYKVRSLAEELKGEGVRVIAQPLARVLYEFRPRNLEAERRASWLSSVEAVQNILLECDSVQAFLDLAQSRKQSEAAKTGDHVTLSTLHSAKGLEWDMVFLAGCEDDSLPHAKSENIEEERRLFYVGMTRARHQLIVTYAHSRNGRARIPSRFLSEAAPDANSVPEGFKWIDRARTAAATKAPAKPRGEVKAPKAKEAAPRKTYKHRGGRSLIPPDERR